MASRNLTLETANHALKDFTRNYESANRAEKFTEKLRMSYLDVLSHEEKGQIREDVAQECRYKVQSLCSQINHYVVEVIK